MTTPKSSTSFGFKPICNSKIYTLSQTHLITNAYFEQDVDLAYLRKAFDAHTLGYMLRGFEVELEDYAYSVVDLNAEIINE